MATSDFTEFTNDFGEWECGICKEGDGADGLRTTHECTKHEFHTTCLTRWRERSQQCPICRFPTDAPPQVQTQEQPSIPSLIGIQVPRLSGMSHGMMRFGGMSWRLLPDRDLMNRITPRVGEAWAIGRDCAYCTHTIVEMSCAILWDCNHYMCHSCVRDNLYQNGINADTGKLFCPHCYWNEFA